MYYKIDNVLYMKYDDYIKDLMIHIQGLIDENRMDEVDVLINDGQSEFKIKST